MAVAGAPRNVDRLAEGPDAACCVPTKCVRMTPKRPLIVVKVRAHGGVRTVSGMANQDEQQRFIPNSPRRAWPPKRTWDVCPGSRGRNARGRRTPEAGAVLARRCSVDATASPYVVVSLANHGSPGSRKVDASINTREHRTVLALTLRRFRHRPPSTVWAAMHRGRCCGVGSAVPDGSGPR